MSNNPHVVIVGAGFGELGVAVLDHKIEFEDGDQIAYDYLILAGGATVNAVKSSTCYYPASLVTSSRQQEAVN